MNFDNQVNKILRRKIHKKKKNKKLEISNVLGNSPASVKGINQDYALTPMPPSIGGV